MNKPFLTRHSPRKPNYDYSLPGYYFVTIVVHNRQLQLATITGNKIELSRSGEIVRECWIDLLNVSPLTSSEAFVVMPNHVHGIVRIHPSESKDNGAINLGDLIRRYKAKTCKQIHEQALPHFQWQRNFYDRIIRTERELRVTQLYITTNPILWAMDPENIDSVGRDISLDLLLMKECGFTEEDIELVNNYVEYRTRAR